MELIQVLQRLATVDEEWDEKAHLFHQVRERLADNETLQAQQAAQAKRAEALSAARGKLRNLELELEGLQDRARKVEADLYGGAIGSPRELENLRRDGEYLKRHIAQLEDETLETMALVEELEATVTQGKQELEAFEQGWAETTREARGSYETLRARLQELQAERERLRGLVPRRELALYDELRRTKGGRPLAPMRNGVCQVCRVTVPSHKMTIAQGGQNAVATCEGCGRILYQA